MKKVINSAPSRRHFLRLTSMAAASALAPTVLWAEQREATDSATSQAEVSTHRYVRGRMADRARPVLRSASKRARLVGAPGTLLARRHTGGLRRGARRRHQQYALRAACFAHALLHAGGTRVLPAFRYLCRRAKATRTGTRISRGPYLLSRRWRSLTCRHAGPQCDYRRYTRHAGPNKPACSLAMRSSSPMVHRFSRCSHSVVRLAGKSCWACVVPARLSK